MGINLFLIIQKIYHRPGLVKKLIDGFFPRAGHRLIGGHHNTFDMIFLVDRIQRNNHLNRRTIRICDDALFRITGDGLGVDLRDHQRDIRVHPPGAGVVHNHTAIFGGVWCKPFAGAAAG